ncbi:hypothetical protein JCM17960_12290 [Magnetospira thiophila]
MPFLVILPGLILGFVLVTLLLNGIGTARRQLREKSALQKRIAILTQHEEKLLLSLGRLEMDLAARQRRKIAEMEAQIKARKQQAEQEVADWVAQEKQRRAAPPKSNPTPRN